MKNLQKEYNSICEKYMSQFCKKQEIDFEGWVGDIVGSIAYCGDFYFSFQDIVWDINSEQNKGLIIEWYYSTLNNPSEAINYYSYTKGLRVK